MTYRVLKEGKLSRNMGICTGEQKCITNLSGLYNQEPGIAIWSIKRARCGERPKLFFIF